MTNVRLGGCEMNLGDPGSLAPLLQAWAAPPDSTVGIQGDRSVRPLVFTFREMGKEEVNRAILPG